MRRQSDRERVGCERCVKYHRGIFTRHLCLANGKPIEDPRASCQAFKRI